MLTATLALLAAAPTPAPPNAEPQVPTLVQEEASPEERLQAIEDEYDEAMGTFRRLYRAASEEERNKVVEEHYPDAEAYVERFRGIAEEFPGTEAAASALVWIASNSRNDESSGFALTALVEDYIESEQIAEICAMLERRIGDGEKYLRAILETSPHHDAKGRACYSLARVLLDQSSIAGELAAADEETKSNYVGWIGEQAVERLLAADTKALTKEAEALFERVVAEFAEVSGGRRKLGVAAEGNLFEIRNLQIGMKAPDIEAEDLDGVTFKLSDYRGKVVVLDFWGNW